MFEDSTTHSQYSSSTGSSSSLSETGITRHTTAPTSQIFQEQNLTVQSTEQKDIIIDNMQERIGELLKGNQELVTIKNQNEMLRDTLSLKESKFENERSSYESRINSLTKQVSILSEQNDDMRKHISVLTSSNEQLKSDVERTRVDLSDVKKTTVTELGSKFQYESNLYEAEIKARNEKIIDLEKQIKLLEDAAEYNKNALNQSLEKVDQLTNTILSIQGTSDEKDKEITYLKVDNSKLSKALNNALSQIEKLTQTRDELALSERNLMSEMENMKTILSIQSKEIETIKGINPDINNFDDLISAVRNQILESKKGVYDMQKVVSETQKYKEALNQMEEANNEAFNRIQKSEESLKQANFRIEELKNKILDKERRIQLFIDKSSATRVVCASNKKIMNELIDIDHKIGSKANIPSLRNLIVTIIIARRLKELSSTREVELDLRNWWWLPTQEDNNMRKKILKGVEALRSKVKFLESEKESLNEIIDGLKKAGEAATKVIEEKDGQIQLLKSKNTSLRGEIHDAAETMNVYVQRSSYDKLVDKHKTLKLKYCNAIQMLQEKEYVLCDTQERNQQYLEKISELKAQLQSQQIENNNLKTMLNNANNEGEILRTALTCKRKEVLSLERGIYSEQRIKSNLTAQCTTLANENVNLLQQRKMFKAKQMSNDNNPAMIIKRNGSVGGTLF